MKYSSSISQNEGMPPRERMGVKFKPILNVDPILFVLPPLHIKLGLVNRAFIKADGYSYFSWSQIRIENIPFDERNAFNIFRNWIVDLNDRLEDKLIFEIQHPTDELDTLRDHLITTKNSLKNPNIPQAERDQLNLDLEVLKH